MVQELYLIRHGQTEYNAQQRFQGQIDVPLDATGETQAIAIAKYLKNRGFTRIFASDLRRARQTAEAISSETQVPVEVDAGLREIQVGEWEGYTRAEIHERWPELLAKWATGQEVRPPGGESRMESSTRVYEAILRLVGTCGEDDVVAMVAHGAVIRGATELMMGLNTIEQPTLAKLGTLNNCEYVHFIRRGHTWMLRMFAGGVPVKTELI